MLHTTNKSPSPSMQDTSSLDGENSLSISMDTYGGSSSDMLSRDSRNIERSRGFHDKADTISYIQNINFSTTSTSNRNAGKSSGRNKERLSTSRDGPRGKRNKSEKELFLKELRQHYELANERASNLATSSSTDDVNEKDINGRKNCANTYSALSALLYATISVAKIDALESYVENRGTQLPTKLFDMKEWQPILQQAKNFRKSELSSSSSSSSPSPLKGTTQSTRSLRSASMDQNNNQHMVEEDNNNNASLLTTEQEVVKLMKEKSITHHEIIKLQNSLSSLSLTCKTLQNENNQLREELDMEKFRASASTEGSNNGNDSTNATIRQYKDIIAQLQKSLSDKSEELLRKDAVIGSNNIKIKELYDNIDETKKLIPSYISNPETPDILSQHANNVVSTSIKSSIAKITANEVENKLSLRPENRISALVSELQRTKYDLDCMQVKLQEMSRSSIANGTTCELRYLSNNQSDQLCKIEIKTITKPSAIIEINVDSEDFRSTCSIGRANDNGTDISIDSQKHRSSDDDQQINENMIVELGKKNEQLSSEISKLSEQLSDQEKKGLEQEKVLSDLRISNADLQKLNRKLNIQQQQEVPSTSSGARRNGDYSFNESSSSTKDQTTLLNRKLVKLEEENVQLRKKLSTSMNYVAPTLQNNEGKLKVAVTIQKIVRGFLGRVRYLRFLIQKQGGTDKFLACTGTRQGHTGWYLQDECTYYYFCRNGREFLPLCGPLTKAEYIDAKKDAVGNEKKYKVMVKIDKSAIHACKAQIESLLEKCRPITLRRQSKSKQEVQPSGVHFPATAVINDLDKKVDELTRDLNLEKRDKVRRRSTSSSKISPRSRNKQIVLIQTRVRMLLARLKVGRVRCLKFGHLDGVYTSMPHTKPGASGWYMKGSKCFYMVARRKKNPTDSTKSRYNSKDTQLLCVVGPIDQEAQKSALDKSKQMSVGDEWIVVDYSCIVALEISSKAQQKTSDQYQRSGPSPEIQAQLRSYVAEIRRLRRELKINTESEKSLIEVQSDPIKLKKIVKIQCLIRKFLAYHIVSLKRLTKLATQQGVLVATRKDRQGKGGWYIAPNGSFYYFALNRDEWNLVAGPVSPDTYHNIVTKNQYLSAKASEIGNVDHQLIPLTPEIASTTKGGFSIMNMGKKLYVHTGTNDIVVSAPITTTFLTGNDNAKARHCPLCSVGSSISESIERIELESCQNVRSKSSSYNSKKVTQDRGNDNDNAFKISNSDNDDNTTATATATTTTTNRSSNGNSNSNNSRGGLRIRTRDSNLKLPQISNNTN